MKHRLFLKSIIDAFLLYFIHFCFWYITFIKQWTFCEGQTSQILQKLCFEKVCFVLACQKWIYGTWISWVYEEGIKFCNFMNATCKFLPRPMHFTKILQWKSKSVSQDDIPWGTRSVKTFADKSWIVTLIWIVRAANYSFLFPNNKVKNIWW